MACVLGLTALISSPILEELILLSEKSNENVTIQAHFFLLPEEYFSHWKDQQWKALTQLNE